MQVAGTEMNIERSPGTVGDLREAAGVVVEMTCSEVLRTGGDLAMDIGMTSGGRQEDLQGEDLAAGVYILPFISILVFIKNCHF